MQPSTRRGLLDSFRAVLKDESGHQIDLMLFVAIMGIGTAIVLPKLLKGRLGMGAILLHAGILMAGCRLFNFIHDRIVNDSGYDMPTATIFIVSLFGLGLATRFGWVSTGIVLGIYGAACLHDAFEKRRR